MSLTHQLVYEFCFMQATADLKLLIHQQHSKHLLRGDLHKFLFLKSIPLSLDVGVFAPFQYGSESGWADRPHMVQEHNHSNAAQHFLNSQLISPTSERMIYLPEHSPPMLVSASKHAAAVILPFNSRVTPLTFNLISFLGKKSILVFHMQVWRARRWTLKDSKEIVNI